MKEARQLALQVGRTLSPGMNSGNMECPVCQGGRTGEKTFSVSRMTDGSIRYNCFRVSCGGARGIIGGSEPAPIKVRERKFEAKPYDFKLTELPFKYTSMFECLFEIPEDDIAISGVKYNEKRNSVVFPIHDMNGFVVGIVDRIYYEAKRPKAITYWFRDVPKYAFPLSSTFYGDTIVLVEDIVSAIKVGRHMPCAALLGTNLMPEVAADIRKHFSRVVIWLDNDADSKALNMRRKYGLFFKDIEIIHSDADPKDTPREEIVELLKDRIV